jgi:hypothetical protein
MAMINDTPGVRAIYEESIQKWVDVFIIFALISIIVTLWYLYKKDTQLKYKYLLLVAWGILPPVWFLVEYFFLFLPSGIAESFEFFKYGQEIASKVWGAVFALISIDLYKSKNEDKT